MPATSTPSTDFLYELLIQNQFGSTQIKLSDIDAQVMEVDTSTLKPGTYQWRVRGHKPGAYETQRWVNDGRNFFEINC
jgi:hypothetical protein